MNKMSRLKIIFISTLILLGTINVNGQSDDKTVTLVVSGQGKTQDEAKENALRHAIESTFGVFIISTTEVQNDQIIKDQIATISSGNILKYDVIDDVGLDLMLHLLAYDPNKRINVTDALNHPYF
jgi:serine/threonine protein kinase